MSTVRRRAIALYAVTGMLLTGCSPLQGLDPVPPDAVSQTMPTAVSDNRAMPEGIVATGTFVSPDGSTSGGIEVVVDGGDARVELLDFTTSHPRLTASASLWLREDDPCADGGGLSFGDFAPDEIEMVLPQGYLHGDWTAIDEIDLTVFAPADTTECINTIVARAPLVWTVPPLRTGLATLTDAGPRGGATGEVETAGGTPVSYRVAANDLAEEVAARFGITVDDLFYLNEQRLPAPYDPQLYVDEVLNLDLTSR